MENPEFQNNMGQSSVVSCPSRENDNGPKIRAKRNKMILDTGYLLERSGNPDLSGILDEDTNCTHTFNEVSLPQGSEAMLDK
jgi:hypothetical protein